MKILLAIITTVLLIGCASQQTTTMQVGETKLAESYGDVAIKTATGSDVFVGISQNFSSEASARNDAALDARRQIVQSLGIVMDMEIFEQVLTKGSSDQILSGDIFSDHKTRVVAEGILAVKPDGYYIEKWMRQTDRGVEYFYTSRCLITYSKATHEQLMTKMATSLLKAAEPMMIQAENAKQQGLIRDALRSAHQVEQLTLELKGYQAIPVEMTAQIKQLLGRAEGISHGIKLLVVIYERIQGEPASSHEFEPRLAQALAKRNLVAIKSSINWNGKDPEVLLTDREVQQQLAWQESADLLLVGIAEVKDINDSKAEHGIYSANMNAQLKLVIPATGEILWETALPGKLLSKSTGFAGDPNQATRNALSLANARRYNPVDPFVRLADDILGVLE